MAFLAPHFEYDVFVSYSHGDPQRTDKSPLKAWTHMLIRDLEAYVRAVDTEFKNLCIWRDEQIDPTILLTDELRAKVKSSSILMIIMSPHYLASRWCNDELEWFRQQVLERRREQGRVFVIRALSTDESQWPKFLLDDRGHALVGFPFYDTATSMPYRWGGSHENNEGYVKSLWQLQTALTKRLRELRANAERQAASLAQGPAAAPAGGPRRIYLHAEHNPVSDEVRRALSEDGITPLSTVADPGRDIADWTRESQNRFETAKHCEALALVRTDDDATFIGDLLEIGVDECERIQTARGMPFPCAVLDRTGHALPIDVSQFPIKRFDLANADWRGKFRGWLDQFRAQPAAAL